MLNKKATFSIKASADDNEQRLITIVANTGEIMRSGYSFDINTLTTMADGKNQLISSLSGGEFISAPFMVDHGRSVRDIAGSIESVSVAEGKLTAVLKAATTEVGNEVYQLAKDGALRNFSISVDYRSEPEDGKIVDGELTEISAVWNGDDPNANIVKVAKKGETMAEKKAMTQEDVDKVKELLDSLVDQQESDDTEEVEASKDEVGEKTADADTTEEVVEEEVEEKQDEQTEEKKEETAMSETKSAARDEQAAKTITKSATQTVKASASNYLDSKEALLDFKNTVLSHHRGSNEQIMAAWGNIVKEKTAGISGDALLPSAIENIFFQSWIDNPGILGTFRMLGVKRASVNAMGGSGEDIRAKGHTKGEPKAEQELVNTQRQLIGKAIYKKQSIDLQDIYDDETGELLTFRVQELASRLANEIALGAILGDGRSTGTPDHRVFDGTRGLWSMVNDINAVTGIGTTLASKVAGVTGDTNYEYAVRALGAVKDQNNSGKILIVPTGFMTSFALERNTNGGLVFPAGTDMKSVLGVKAIYEMDEMVGSDFAAIAYVDQSYLLVGERTATTRTDFDLNVNKDIMLLERYVGGSLNGYKVAAGVTPAV